MRIETAFSCGDKGWVFWDGRARQLVIGQIRAVVTNSPGIEDSDFDNFSPAESYEETYMCVETGIGSGSVWTFGKSIFATEAECLAANAEEIDRKQKYEAAQRQRERNRLLQEESSLREKLARIEAIKSEATE